MSTNQPMLFYSSRCAYSKQIIDTMEAMNKKNLCQLIRIDGRSRAQLPSFLQRVPTLYLPETKDVIVGPEIYAYIAKPVVARREVPNQNTAKITPDQQIRNSLPTAGAGGNDNTGYAAWSFSQVKGLTEQFTEFTEKPKFSDAQANFSFLGADTSAPSAPEPQTQQSFQGGKIDKNGDIENRMKALQKARDNEFQGITRK